MRSKPETDADTELAASGSGEGAAGGPSGDSAFERLLGEAAKVTSAGRLLAPGTQLCDGRFVIRRRLGEGGMGVAARGSPRRRAGRGAARRGGDCPRCARLFACVVPLAHDALRGVKERAVPGERNQPADDTLAAWTFSWK